MQNDFLNSNLCKTCVAKLESGDWSLPHDLCLQCQGKREDPKFRKTAIREMLKLLLSAGMLNFGLEKEEYALILIDIAEEIKKGPCQAVEKT